MSLRKEFVMRVLAKEAPVTELCRRYRISRKTGYKWLARFKAKGLEGLVDESHRPLESPQETPNEMAQAILELRRAHWRWGARKIRRLLVKQHGTNAPSTSTVARVLERHGFIKKRRRRPGPIAAPVGRPNPVVVQPNDLWTVDFKGWWRALDGTRCEPLTVRDGFSRYMLAIRLLPDNTTEPVRRVFKELFDEYGVPLAIQSDNGPPFASTRALAGLTRLSAWWVSLGIEVIRSRPGCPQDNGGHERMHADMQREIRARVAETRPAQQRACDEWRADFNHVRPHEALDMRTPSEVYRPSPRRPVAQLGALRPGCERRTVDPRGFISWNMQRVYVTTALVGQTVGLMRVEEVVMVWLYGLLLGSFRYGHGDSVQPLSAASTEVSPGDGSLPSVGVTAGDKAIDVSPGDSHPVTGGLSPGGTAEVSPGDGSGVTPGVTPQRTAKPAPPERGGRCIGANLANKG